MATSVQRNLKDTRTFDCQNKQCIMNKVRMPINKLCVLYAYIY